MDVTPSRSTVLQSGRRSRAIKNALGPITAEKYAAFTEAYNVRMLPGQFVGLCSYLCIILRWGLRLAVDDMDCFIYAYETFESKIPELEQAVTEPSTPYIPAYHQWFLQHSASLNRQDQSILTEAVLRSIWLENPYTFLRTEESLKLIVKKNQMEDETMQSSTVAPSTDDQEQATRDQDTSDHRG